MVLEGLQDAAAGDVERLDQCGVGRVEGLGVGLDALGRRGERDVRIIEGQVQEERLGLVPLDELHRVVGVAELALAALRRFGAGVGLAGEVFVKPVIGRLVAFAAEVPLAHGRGRIALGLEQLGDRLDAFGQIIVHRRGEHPLGGAVAATREEGRDLEPGRALAGQEAGA